MTPRRSRMRRMRTGKHIVTTPRDIEIFRALTRYRYLRSTYLHAFAGGLSETRFKERLGDLFHEGYLDRPEGQWRFADCRHAPAVYELGHGARRVLAELGPSEDERRICLGAGAQRQFHHSLMVCEIVASIELATRAVPELRFVPWPEILAKAPKSARTASFPLQMPVGPGAKRFVVPDAIFGLEYGQNGKKAYRFFALEADRGTMPVVRRADNQTSYLGKLAAYRAAMQSRTYASFLGMPNLLVLTITSSRPHMEAILAAMHGAGWADAAFLFKAAEKSTAPASAILMEPWTRVGHSPISIMAP